MTVADIISAAGRLIAWHPGQSGSSDEQNAALQALNAMLDAWNAQRLAIYLIRPEVYPLTAGQQTYTIGPGGDLSGPRPAKIERANIILPSGARYHLSLVSVYDWAQLSLPDTSPSVPTRLYYDRAVPLATLRLWPKPDAGQQLELFTWAKFNAFATLGDQAHFPEGYREAVIYNLALRLAQELRVPIPDFVVINARESLANVKRLNLPRPVMQTEPAVGCSTGFDWRTGE